MRWERQHSGLILPQPKLMAPGYPCCCGAGTGCEGTSTMTVDLDTGGLTDNGCSQCPDFAGEYITDVVQRIEDPFNFAEWAEYHCQFQLLDENLCGATPSRYLVAVSLNQVGLNYYWAARVQWCRIAAPRLDYFIIDWQGGPYFNDPWAGEDGDGKIELSRSYTYKDYCAGDLPDPIYIWR